MTHATTTTINHDAYKCHINIWKTWLFHLLYPPPPHYPNDGSLYYWTQIFPNFIHMFHIALHMLLE